MRRALRDPGLLAAFAGMGLLLLVFVLHPTVRVLLFPRLTDYLAIPTSVRWMEATRNSLIMMVLSSATATAVGAVFALAFTRDDIPWAGLFRAVAQLPLFAPPFMVAFAYILLFGRQGLITRSLLGLDVNIFGWPGLWIVQTVAFFPYAALVVTGVLRGINPTLEYAAADLGADEAAALRDITLGLARPGITGALLVVAITVLADFGNAVIIAGGFPLLATEAWFRLEGMGDLRGAALVVSILILPTTALFLLERYVVGRRQYVTITGRGGRIEPPPTPSRWRWTVFAVCATMSVLVVLVYAAIAVGACVTAWGYNWSLTLEHWRLSADRLGTLVNSLKLAGTSALMTATLALLAAFLVSRDTPLRRAMDFLSMLPGALPGVFVGVGYVLAFNQPPLDLAGTFWILPLALAFWHLPLGYQTALAGLRQIERAIEEAASNLGATGLHLVWDIYLPLLRKAFADTFAVSFIRSVVNVSIVVFLVSPGHVVATFAILSLIVNGAWGGAAALTASLLVVTLTAAGVARVVLGYEVRAARVG
ncbi:MAG: iron ABC transporter permease [Armatimonadota bacterium]|nr:iron ABC transporter permease [Armatimonadota bacterium]